MTVIARALVYIFIFSSWAVCLPWLLTMGFPSIPEALAIMLTPPTFSLAPFSVVDYTIKVALNIALEILPLISIFVAPFVLIKSKSRRDMDIVRSTAHLLWIKSAVMLIALALAQFFFGNPYLTSYLTSWDTFLVLIASPVLALGSLGLLLANSRKNGELVE